MDGAEGCVGGGKGRGQEQLAQAAACHQIEHFILIFPVQSAAVGGGDQSVILGHIELVARQNSDGSGTSAGIGDDHIAGALVNGGMDNGVMVVQISFQHIGTVQSHADFFHMHAHPALAFMQNGTFHIAQRPFLCSKTAGCACIWSTGFPPYSPLCHLQ